MIQTSCGFIRGTSCQWKGVVAYKGIRYATAGRFEYPKLVSHWDGIYDASQYGACCYQPRAFYNEANSKNKAFYYHEFREGQVYHYSEDCLFLNIWTPEDANENSNLPVIFYIHGGSYKSCCGNENHFDGPVWATKGVIAVTCNYRLGPLGFVCLPELKEEAGHTGNYGLFDQITALLWVKENIRAFGGNPEYVTVMGQSAGAMSIQNLCVSPLTDGLFSKAVMNSGGGVGMFFNTKTHDTERYAFWKKVMKRCDCKTLEEFCKVEPQKLFTAWEDEMKVDWKSLMVASPCVDGVLLSDSTLSLVKKGMQKDITYMMGSNSQDIVPPILHTMAKMWCVLQPKQECYCWFFDRQLPGDKKGAWHSSELWYFFGTLDNCWRPFTEYDRELSNQMVSYLCNFAKTGNPNGEGLAEWKPVKSKKDKVLCLGEKPTAMGNVNLLNFIKILDKR